MSETTKRLNYEEMWRICCDCDGPEQCDPDYEIGFYVKHGRFPCGTLQASIDKIRGR